MNLTENDSLVIGLGLVNNTRLVKELEEAKQPLPQEEAKHTDFPHHEVVMGVLPEGQVEEILPAGRDNEMFPISHM